MIVDNFEKRGWLQVVGDNADWNVYWAAVHNVKQWFNPDTGLRMGENMVINHFPNHQELTRKDSMAKNIKRYKKEVEKEQREYYRQLQLAAEMDGRQVAEQEEEEEALGDLDFVPPTFTLPADYSIFAEEFRRTPNSTWIMKPARGAQGTGIFLINKLAQVKRWAPGGKFTGAGGGPINTYVVSRYIENPLLVSNRKFDLRLYVLVTSYRPLMVYIHKHGFARFCTEDYSSNVDDMDNAMMHLTNVAIQKHGEDYNAKHGGKWSMQNLMMYIESTRGAEVAGRLRASIDSLIVHSLLACQSFIMNDRHCFELYGYDILIDSELKPWLIEVNASPSLSTTTEVDRQCKHAVISDTLDIVCPWRDKRKKKTKRPGDLGGFSVLFDQEAVAAAVPAEGDKSKGPSLAHFVTTGAGKKTTGSKVPPRWKPAVADIRRGSSPAETKAFSGGSKMSARERAQLADEAGRRAADKRSGGSQPSWEYHLWGTPR